MDRDSEMYNYSDPAFSSGAYGAGMRSVSEQDTISAPLPYASTGAAPFPLRADFLTQPKHSNNHHHVGPMNPSDGTQMSTHGSLAQHGTSQIGRDVTSAGRATSSLQPSTTSHHDGTPAKSFTHSHRIPDLELNIPPPVTRASQFIRHLRQIALECVKHGGAEGEIYRSTAIVYLYASAGLTLWRYYAPELQASLEDSWDKEETNPINLGEGSQYLHTMRKHLHDVHGPRSASQAYVMSQPAVLVTKVKGYLFGQLLRKAQEDGLATDRFQLPVDMQTAIGLVMGNPDTLRSDVAEVMCLTRLLDPGCDFLVRPESIMSTFAEALRAQLDGDGFTHSTISAPATTSTSSQEDMQDVHIPRFLEGFGPMPPRHPSTVDEDAAAYDSYFTTTARLRLEVKDSEAKQASDLADVINSSHSYQRQIYEAMCMEPSDPVATAKATASFRKTLESFKPDLEPSRVMMLTAMKQLTVIIDLHQNGTQLLTRERNPITATGDKYAKKKDLEMSIKDRINEVKKAYREEKLIASDCCTERTKIHRLAWSPTVYQMMKRHHAGSNDVKAKSKKDSDKALGITTGRPRAPQ